MTQGRVGCATRPGGRPEWLFVVGHAFIAAVPIATSPVVVDNLAELAEAQETTLETIVSVLPLGGDQAVQSFVVVLPEPAAPPGHDRPTDGIAVSVVIRGEIAADVYSVGGSRRFTDRDIRPWLLADFQSVVGVVIGSPRFTAVPSDEIGGGQDASLGAMTGDTLYWLPTAPDAAPEPLAHNPSDIDDTIIRSRRVTNEAHATDEDTVIRSRVVSDDTVIRAQPAVEDTVIRAPRAAAARVVDAHPEDARAMEDTVLRPTVVSDETVIRPPTVRGDTIIRPRPAPAEPPPTVPTPVQSERSFDAALPRAVPQDYYGFRVAGGEERRLDSAYYLGRRPSAPRISSGPVPLLLQVDSRTSAVSATHLEIRQVGDSVVITDLGSTNGTVVRLPRGKKERLRAGQSFAVIPGTTVDIGDGNIIEILPVNGR